MDVIVAGAGPVGLMLAVELRLHGVGVLVLDTLAEASPHARAFGLHARSTETMELRGLVPRLEAAAAAAPMVAGIPPSFRSGIPLVHFAGIRTVRLDSLEASRPGMLAIAQTGVEAVLGARAAELGAVIRRGVTVTGLTQDAAGVTVSTSDDESLRAAYLVGCDGGRSIVRKLAGFAFPGSDPAITGRLAEVAVPEVMADPGMGWHRCSGGILQVLPGRVLAVEFDGPPADRDDPVTVAEMSASLSRITGRPIEIRGEPGWMTRFTDNTRLPATTATAGSCWPGTPPTSTHRSAARGSTSASWTRPTWAGNSPPPWPAGRPTASSTPTRPNAARSPPACCTTPGPRSRS